MEQLHYLTLELLRMAKRYQTKTLGQNTALTVLLQIPPGSSAPNRAQIEQAIAEGERVARSISDPEYDELERALLDGSDFQRALRTYLDKHK